MGDTDRVVAQATEAHRIAGTFGAILAARAGREAQAILVRLCEPARPRPG